MNDNNHNSDSENEVDDSGARDHYVAVGKSKLRNEQPLLDDPRYAGQRTSRKDIYSEEEDDEEIVSDNELGSEQESDDNDDAEDLAANAEEEEEQSEEEEEDQSEADDAEDDDEINAELRKIQEEEKYALDRK